MIEYIREQDIYIVHFSDEQSDVKGWVQELNGLVFVGLNDLFIDERSAIINRLLSKTNDQIRKEISVFDLRRKA